MCHQAVRKTETQPDSGKGEFPVNVYTTGATLSNKATNLVDRGVTDPTF